MTVMTEVEGNVAAKKQKVNGVNRFEVLKSYTTVVADTGEINAMKE